LAPANWLAVACFAPWTEVTTFRNESVLFGAKDEYTGGGQFALLCASGVAVRHYIGGSGNMVVMPPNVAVAIELSDEERAQLEAWTRRRTGAQALAQRSRIVLLAAEGLRNTEIAERMGINRAMAAKWRSRFAGHRLDGLTDEPRSGRPRTISDEHVEAVLTKTLESPPKGATHWSTRSMAKEVGLTQTAVSRIWRAFGLQPHRQDALKLSQDPLSSTRSTTLSGSTSTRPSAPLSSASTRSPRSRP
jgi:transposase